MCVIQNQCLLNQKSGLTGRPQAQGQPDDHHKLEGRLPLDHEQVVEQTKCWLYDINSK